MEKERDAVSSVVNHYEAGANCQVFNGSISGCVFAMPGSNVTQQAPPPLAKPPTAAEKEYPTAMLVECVDEVRPLFWGNSSMAVIFCVCRDCYHYADNMSQFERDFGCRENLLATTFRDNPFMRVSSEKWPQMNVMQRVQTLVDAYKNAVFKRVTKYAHDRQAEDKASPT